MPGDQIFSASGTNSVFAALNNLVADYSSGNVEHYAGGDGYDRAKHCDELRLAAARDHRQLDYPDYSASNAVTSDQMQLTGAQTNLMQADVATVSTQLSLAETQQTALEDVIAQLDSASNRLFSKL